MTCLFPEVDIVSTNSVTCTHIPVTFLWGSPPHVSNHNINVFNHYQSVSPVSTCRIFGTVALSSALPGGWEANEIPRVLKEKQHERADAAGIRVWSWNIESLVRPGLLHMLVDVLTEHHVDVAFCQETRWRDTVTFPLPKGWCVANIGTGEGNDGVAVMLSPDTYRSVASPKNSTENTWRVGAQRSRA